MSDRLPESETQTTGVKGKGAGTSKSNENVDFGQIVENIHSDTTSEASRSENLRNIKQQNKGVSRGKKKRSGKTPTPSLSEELAEEEKRLRELIGPGLWSCLEDVGLDNTLTG
ncbi:uncharacterized protein PV07_06422 [Cladophialophora immunda]|uniref:Uncharacterized protein n=1 Tax=Cladophialophora immunda TaxID=569365 RepID=A0A0D2C628_9EURO|nr:uncharacterized protein PV07_06422 [Cladophialophora immunda]KIW26603.1 hypothetical protein PV07_06422 [Cladophialophora immunda]